MIPRKSQTSVDLDKKIVATSTEGNKGLTVIGDTGTYRIKWTRGGHLPKGLDGRFTSRQIAEEKIALWVARR